MYSVLTITGSPSVTSRSSLLVETVEKRLDNAGVIVQSLRVRDLPAEDLLHARFGSPAIVNVVQQVARADAIIIGTPIYKAAYSGILKALLDLLPQDAFDGKIVLPLATGGSPAHLLAVDYALRPVLSSLGARYVLGTIYASDSQIAGDSATGYVISTEIIDRLQKGIDQLTDALQWSAHLSGNSPAQETVQRRYA